MEILALYETVSEELSERDRRAVSGVDYITFTSSSTVRFFLTSLGGELPPTARLVSIGPVTSATLREHGLEPQVEAARHDIDGVIEALLADAAERA